MKKYIEFLFLSLYLLLFIVIIYVIIKNWVYLPNEISMHLDNPNTYTSKLIIFLPLLLSLLSLVFMFLYRKKDSFKKITNSYLQYSLSLYFLYITNFYIYWLLHGSNMFFNEIVLFSLPIIIVFILIAIDLYFKLRERYRIEITKEEV